MSRFIIRHPRLSASAMCLASIFSKISRLSAIIRAGPMVADNRGFTVLTRQNSCSDRVNHCSPDFRK